MWHQWNCFIFPLILEISQCPIPRRVWLKMQALTKINITVMFKNIVMFVKFSLGNICMMMGNMLWHDSVEYLLYWFWYWAFQYRLQYQLFRNLSYDTHDYSMYVITVVLLQILYHIAQAASRFIGVDVNFSFIKDNIYILLWFSSVHHLWHSVFSISYPSFLFIAFLLFVLIDTWGTDHTIELMTSCWLLAAGCTCGRVPVGCVYRDMFYCVQVAPLTVRRMDLAQFSCDCLTRFWKKWGRRWRSDRTLPADCCSNSMMKIDLEGWVWIECVILYIAMVVHKFRVGNKPLGYMFYKGFDAQCVSVTMLSGSQLL